MSKKPESSEIKDERVKLRRAVFTFYPDPQHVFDMPKCDYIKRWVYQYEQCPTTQKIHIQGYVEFKDNTPIKRFIQQVSGSNGGKKFHIEKAKADAYSNFVYCTKQESRIYEPVLYGDWTEIEKERQGRRNDLKEFYKALSNPAIDLKTIQEDFFPQYIKYGNMAEKVMSTQRQKVRKLDDIGYSFIWFYGKPGSGKSYYAHSLPNVYVKAPGKWFDGLLPSHETLVIDDYDGTEITYGDMKRLADRYPINVEGKGYVIPFHIKKIIVTSNYLPWQLFSMEKEPSVEISPLVDRFNIYEIIRSEDGKTIEQHPVKLTKRFDKQDGITWIEINNQTQTTSLTGKKRKTRDYDCNY